MNIIHDNVLNYNDVEAVVKGDSFTDGIISLDSKMSKGTELRSKGTEHILMPVGLKDGDPRGMVHVQSEGKLPSTSVMRVDVAKFLVDSMGENIEGIIAICQYESIRGFAA